MDTLLKFYNTYKKYYLMNGKYTCGHLKFKNSITKEQRMQLMQREEVPLFNFDYKNDTYTGSFSFYENAGYMHFKMLGLKNGKRINTKTFVAIVRDILVENGYLTKEDAEYNKRK